MSPLQLLQQLQQKQQIEPVSRVAALSCIQQEQASLKRLQQQPGSFLNQYDQLFRYVSLWLLQQGYVLTGHQPHQALLQVTAQWACSQQIRSMINSRHRLKKRINLQPATLLETNTLQALLSQVRVLTLQACENPEFIDRAIKF